MDLIIWNCPLITYKRREKPPNAFWNGTPELQYVQTLGLLEVPGLKLDYYFSCLPFELSGIVDLSFASEIAEA